MNNATNYLSGQARVVNEELERILPAGNSRPARLHQAMRYSMFAGGKRLRPVLCIAACEACGGTAEQALTAACALELLHTSTLIHDDLPAMDDDTLRRGRPTCHIKFDEAVAILAGDALLSLSFEILAPLPDGARMVQELTRCFAQVAGGQTEDLAAEGRAPDADTVDFIHRNKTAALIRTSCVLGGICAGANIHPPSPEGSGAAGLLENLALYGQNTGLAFQLVDDLLDGSSTEAKLGKNIGSDKEKGKMTWPAVHGIEATRKRIEKLTAEANEAADALPDGGQLKGLAELMAARSS